MIVETFPVGPLACNCVIVGDAAAKEAVVVDPGGEPERILARLAALGLRATRLAHTHAHIDHVDGTRALAEATGAKILLHERDRWLYENLAMQGEFLGWKPEEPLPVDGFLAEGDELRLGGSRLRAIHTPGHTPGSLCFYLDGKGLVLSGDTLFAGSIGRTDLWGGSMEEILRSIRSKLLRPFGAETAVLPGHGPATTIGEERRSNPFVGEGA